MKQLRILFSTRTVILLPWWNAEKQLKFSSWGSIAEHTRCVWKSAGSLRRRARFFNPVPGSKSADIYNICAAAAIFAPPPLSCNFHNDDKPEQKWNTVIWKKQDKKIACRSRTPFKVFRTLVFVASLDSQDYRLTGQWALASSTFSFLIVSYYLRVFHFKNGGIFFDINRLLLLSIT